MKSELLSSIKNPLLKDVRRAMDRGALTTDGCAVAETFHLLEEAVRSGCKIRAVIAAESALANVERHLAATPDVTLVRVPDEVFKEISGTEANQGVMTLARVPEWDLDAVLGGESLVVVLDGIQDPGNAGAILRTAEAFGATGAIYLKGTVSPYNPKAIRASAGSVFRLPMVAGVDADFACAALEQAKLEVFAAMPQAAQRLGELDLRRRCAIVIGSEARGVSPRMQEIARGVRIPTSRVESLNAAMAAGILLYEANRQRQAVA